MDCIIYWLVIEGDKVWYLVEYNIVNKSVIFLQDYFYWPFLTFHVGCFNHKAILEIRVGLFIWKEDLFSKVSQAWILYMLSLVQCYCYQNWFGQSVIESVTDSTFPKNYKYPVS